MTICKTIKSDRNLTSLSSFSVGHKIFLMTRKFLDNSKIFARKEKLSSLFTKSCFVNVLSDFNAVKLRKLPIKAVLNFADKAILEN